MSTQRSPKILAASAGDEPLRIALYTPCLPESGASNGIVTYVRIMRDALRELGHHVFLVTTESMACPDGSVVPLPRLNRVVAGLRLRVGSTFGDNAGEAWVRMNVRNAFEAARRAGAQVFEIEESFGWAGRLAGRGVAIVERLHGPHVFVRDEVEAPQAKRTGDRRQAAEFASFAKVQAITSPTQGLIDALVQYGLDRSIARVIPNPIPQVAAAQMWRLADTEHNQVLFVGRFDLCKGADIAIRAFAEAAAREPSLNLVIAGPDTGVREAGGSVLKFADFVAKEVSPEMRSRIQFLGAQSPADIAALRRRSAIALMTSRFETFGYTIAEAMAAGMPVLTSATFGGKSLIRDGVDGRVVPVADVSQTARVIIEMTTNEDRLQKMGQSAYHRVGRLLAPERIAAQTVDLIVKRSPGPSNFGTLPGQMPVIGMIGTIGTDLGRRLDDRRIVRDRPRRRRGNPSPRASSVFRRAAGPHIR